MKTFLILCLSALPLHAQAPAGAAQTAPAPKMTVSGSVVTSTTGAPINRATVTLTRVNAPPNPLGANAQGAPPPTATAGARGAAPQGTQPAANAQAASQQVSTFTATTDGEGKFQVKDLDPGPYRIVAARNGFARQEFGQRNLNRPGTVVNLRVGQPVPELAFKLTPASNISGRVMDSNGEPLTGVTVQALRSTYDATGKRTMQPVATARTNDLGEYRLYWLNPGRYFVSANAQRSAMELISSQAAQVASQPQSAEQAAAVSAAASLFGPGANPNEVADTGFGLTYYPGTTDASRSVALDLPAGTESRAIDFTLARQQRVKVSGRVVDADTGRPPQTAQVSVSSHDSLASSNLLDSLIGMDPTATRYNPNTGEFVLPSVASGSYWLQVLAQNPTNNSQPAAPANAADALAVLATINTARIPLEVHNSDLDNIQLSVSSGATIPGKIRVEGAQANSNPLERVNVSLQSASGGVNILSLLAGPGARPNADGTFSIPRVTTGDYKVAVSGLGQTLYIKEARFGQIDALPNGLSISLPTNASLDIVLGSNPGQVSGTLSDASQKPVSGVQAVLIPEQRNRQDLYKVVVTDPEGKFTIRGITPGDYKIFAWEDIEPFSYYDSGVLSQYEQQGKAIRVQEGAPQPVEIKIIPAAQ